MTHQPHSCATLERILARKMAANLEMEALRTKVEELEAQLAARDAEIAQLKGEVKVEAEPDSQGKEEGKSES